MNRLTVLLALALTMFVGSLGMSAPAKAATGILVATCEQTTAPCWDGQTPTPWSYDLTGTDLMDTGLGTTQPLLAEQFGCCVIRSGALQIVFQTPGGPVTETAPEYNGSGANGLYTIAEYFIPVDATSAVISGTFGNSVVPNTSLENLYFGSVVPEPATWAMLLVGFGGLGAMMRTQRRKLAIAA